MEILAFKCLTRGLALSVMLSATGPAWAQEGRGREPAAPRAAVQQETIRVSQLLKTKVLLQNDFAAGQIVDFVLSDGGCVEYVVASHDDRYYIIPYSAITWRHADRVVFIDMPQARFNQVQFFAADAWPDFHAVAYRDKVFTTFGVKAARTERNHTTLRPAAEAREERKEKRQERRETRKTEREERTPKDGDAPTDGAGDDGELGKPAPAPRTEDKPTPKPSADKGTADPKPPVKKPDAAAPRDE